MSVGQLDIVHALAHLPTPATLASLVGRLACSVSGVDDGMRKLVRQGFVDRVRIGDGVMRYRLTEAGSAASKDADGAIRQRVIVLVQRQLERSAKPLSNGDIALALDHAVSRRQITFALNALKERGVIVKFGERTGTTWLAASLATAVSA